MKTRTWIIVGAAAAAAVGLAAGTAILLREVWDSGRADVTQDKAAEAQAILGAKVEIAARMPQAQSTTFGKAFVHWEGTMASVCGDVDVVEEQDSFDGPERFVYSQGGLLLEEVEGSDALTQKWNDVCR